jgi:cobalt/nickel transport system permease protein
MDLNCSFLMNQKNCYSDLPCRYRMKQVGYTIGTIFIRSYEQGERVYTSMLCRGYGSGSYIFLIKKPLKRMEWIEFSVCMIFIIAIPVIVWLAPFRLV